MSLVLGLGLEHSCPWPRERLSSERLSLALASDFFVSLALALASSLVSSTPPLLLIYWGCSSVDRYRFFNEAQRIQIFEVLCLKFLSSPHQNFLDPPLVSNYQYEQELNRHWLLSSLQTFFTELALLVTNNNKRNATRECKPHKRKR